MISPQSIENLKQQVDIIEIIGSYIDLKRAGSNYSACCPFHQEKTPSFMVSPSKNAFHCYGCGVGGDAIKFIMEYEKCSFVESLEKIAQITNFQLEYEAKSKYESFQSEYTLLEKIKDYYHQNIYANTESLHYILQRGVSEESVKRFEIGLCPSSLENIKYCENNALDKNKLTELGVLGHDNTRYYARFNERIMFPIYSPLGKPVGFGGRTLKEGLAKYLNSPQSKLFNKSKLLYGYHLAKESIYRQRQIIITEGYLDVIMLHQAGFKNAVATLGTALTKDHLPLLNKGEPEIILSYDGDKAGINAALKASHMLAGRKEGGVVLFSDGMDPADMVAQGRFQELARIFAQPMPFIEFILRQIPKEFDLNNPMQKEKALKTALDFLHTLSPLLQEEYKNLCATLLQIPLHLVRTKQERLKSPASTLSPNIPAGNLLEALIIRYMLEDSRLLDYALDYIDAGIFTQEREAFEALLRQDSSHPSLRAISLNPNLLLTPEGFKRELVLLILRYNYSALESIQKNTKLDFSQKSFILRKIKNNISKLKQGELIAYESFSTF